MLSSSGSRAAPRVPGSEAADDADADYQDKQLRKQSSRNANPTNSKTRAPTMVW